MVFAKLPEIGADVRPGVPMGEIESTKSTSDLYSPVTGRVVERNEQLEDRPELVNEDPYGEGWLVVIEITEPVPAELLEAEQYKQYVGTLD